MRRDVEIASRDAAGSPLARWGRLMGRRAWLVVTVWFVLLAGAAAYGSGVASRLTIEGGYDETADSWRSYQLLQRDFRDASPDVVVTYSTQTTTVDDPAFRAAVAAVVSALPRRLAPTVVNGLDAAPTAGLVSPDRRAVQVWVSLPTSEIGAVFEHYHELRPLLQANGIRTDIGGLVAMGDDLATGMSRDSARAEALALPLVVWLGVLIFGSVVAAGLPSVVGAVAVVVALAALRVVNEVTPVAVYALTVVSLLGLGLAIDYTLFVVNRFREELSVCRAAGHSGRAASVAALGPTVATAGRTVIVSAVIVATAMAGLLVFPLTSIRSLAYGAIPAVLGAMLAAVTLLPAVLALLGHQVDALRLPGINRSARRPRTVAGLGSPTTSWTGRGST